MKDFNIKYIVGTVIVISALLILGQYAFAAQSCAAQCADRDPWDMAYCLDDCKASKQANAAQQELITQFAGAASLRPQTDDQPLCDTDPYWCFNFAAKPKEIMTADGSCHHPLGCGY